MRPAKARSGSRSSTTGEAYRAARAGVGLESMRERAEELGGAIVVEAGDVGGTRVVAQLPLASVPRPASRSVAASESAEADQTGLPAPEGHRA